MYAGHVACVLSPGGHVEYAQCALLRLEKDGTTDGRTPDRYITLTARCSPRNSVPQSKQTYQF